MQIIVGPPFGDLSYGVRVFLTSLPGPFLHKDSAS